MTWYAETAVRRTGQVVADVAMLVWTWGWWRLGRTTHDLIAALGAPGRGLATTGDRFTNAFDNVAETVGGTPLVGGALRAPFVELADASASIGDLGRAQDGAAGHLADWLGLLVVLVPVLVVGAAWLTVRVRGARRTGAARRLRDSGGEELLALRALVRCSPGELLTVSSTPVEDWRAGRVHDLADLELRRSGLRVAATTG